MQTVHRQNVLDRRRFLIGTGMAGAAGASAALLPSHSAHAKAGPGFPTDLVAAGKVDWRAVRRQFLLPADMVYLNSGSEGSMPGFVQAGLNRYSAQWAANPSYSFFDDPVLGEDQTVNRAALARFTGTAAENICITNNTTMGLAMVVNGLDFKRGDQILTTNQEHYSLLSPLNVLTQRFGVEVVQVPIPTPPPSPEAIVAAFENAISTNPKVRGLFFSHVTWTTGLRLPVAELCALARRQGAVTLVDGAQSMGVVDLDFNQLGCDFYACPGHKWLNGPPGTGILYIRDAARNPFNLWPTISEESLEPQNPISTQLQVRGCNNTPSYAAMVMAMEFEAAIGKRAIEQRLVELSAAVKLNVVSRWGTGALFTPSDPRMSSGITAFVPSTDPNKRHDQNFINTVVTALQKQFGIWGRSTLFVNSADPSGQTNYAIRISTNIFNDERQIVRLFDALSQITKES